CHPMVLTVFAFSHVALWSFLAQLPTAKPPTSAYLPENLYLVHAKTVSVSGNDAAPTAIPRQARLVVTRVYLGPEELKGKRFECETSHWQPMGSGAWSLPRDDAVTFVEEGVEGLWWLYHDRKADAYRPELRGKVVDELKIRYRFPIQKHLIQF